MAGDPYYWARDAGLYIEQDHLCQLVDRDDGKTLIIDVRDDDNRGGAIIGAVHCPDSSFDVAAVAELAAGKEAVVFHCMESARRAPRCAQRLHDHWAAGAARTVPDTAPLAQPRICVLQGGADLWIRRFWRDPARVVEFDSDYWGFGDHKDTHDHTDVAGHRMYTRPIDQPATPWSKAGTEDATNAIASVVTTYQRDGCRPLSVEEMERAESEQLQELDDRSVGCVVFTVSRHTEATRQMESDDTRCVLMIKQRAPRGKQSYWAFPKGHADEGETDEECAIRETMEETGVSVSLRPNVFAEVGYSFIKQMHKDRWRKHPAYPDESARPTFVHHKIVRYYLATAERTVDSMQPLVGDEHQDEVEAVEWVPCSEAEERLAHEESKGVFRELLAQCGT